MFWGRLTLMASVALGVWLLGGQAWAFNNEPSGEGIPGDAQGIPAVTGGPLVQQEGVPRDAFHETTDLAMQYRQLAAAGQSGSEVVSENVDWARGRHEETVIDLRVRVQGGYVTHRRELVEGREWQFNSTWASLELTYESGADEETDAPREIHRGEYRYDPSDSDGTYQYDQRRHIDMTDDGFRWRDRQGNDIQYDRQGRIQSYGDANGVRVYFDLDDNDRIESIRDTHGNEVMQFERGSDGRLKSVTDRTGRSVEYEWEGHADTGSRLVRVQDVLGEEWEYEYDLFQYHDETVHLMTERRGPGAGHNLTLDYVEDDSGGCTRRRSSRWVWDEDEGKWGLVIDCGATQSGRSQPLLAARTDGEGVIDQHEYHYDEGLGEYRLIRRDEEGGMDVRDYNLQGELVKHQVAREDRVETVERRHIDDNVRIREDGDGNRTITEMGEWDNPVHIEHPDGSVEEFEWHSSYRLPTRYTDENGNVIELEYDSNGNLTRRVEAVGTPEERVVEHEYDDYGNRITTHRRGSGNAEDITETREYDSYGNLTALTGGEGNRFELRDHDPLGNPREVVDGRGEVWQFQYDDAGNMTRMESPKGRVTEFEYDGAGNLQGVREPTGEKTTLDYDARGRVMTVTNPLGEKTRFTYDAADRITSIIDAQGESMEFRYTPDGRPKSFTDRDGERVSWDYEDAPVGMPGAVHYATRSERFEYDSRSRRAGISKSAEDAPEREVAFDRDHGGRVIERHEPMERSHQYEYDALDRRIALIDPAGQRTELDYDAHDNLREVTNPRQIPIRSYEYDRNRRLVKELMPDGEAIEYDYDPNGNLTRVTYPEGNTLVYGYDADGLLAEVQYFDDPGDIHAPEQATRHISFDYDDAGRMIGYEDKHSSADYDYDDAGRLTDVTVDYGDFELSYAYSYYPGGRVKTFTDPEGQTYSYDWTPGGKLREVDIPGEGVYRFHDYQGEAPTRMTLPGGATKDIDYDGYMQMQELTARDPAGNELLDWSYEHDVTGKVTEREREGEPTVYDYDILDRLTGVEGPDESNEFSYDPVGNRESESAFQDEDGTPHDWQYDDRDRLIQRGPIEYEYDANGNRVLERDTRTDTETTYEYDAQNRLIKVKEADNTVAKYAYDPFGQRISKEVNGEKMYFLYSPDGLIAEADDVGNVHTSYGWQPNSLWGTDPLFIRQEGQYGYYLKDHLGAPWAVVSSSGSTLWEAAYDAFGKTTVLTSEITSNLRFPGQYYDAETGEHYNFYRYYAPELGRYQRADPIGKVGGINSYLYAAGNSVLKFDAYGLVEWTATRFGGGMFVIAGTAHHRFHVVSECVNGERVEAEVWVQVSGFGASVGATMLPMSGDRDIKFTTPSSIPDASAFHGLAGVVSIGVEIAPIGFGYRRFNLADARYVPGTGDSVTGKIEAGGSVASGTSTVMSSQTVTCKCGG